MRCIKKLFWKTYQADFGSCDGKYTNTLFFRGFVWEVVQMAYDASKEKTKLAGEKWTLRNIKRIK